MKKLVFKPFDASAVFLGAIAMQIVFLLLFTVFVATYSMFAGIDASLALQSNVSKIITVLLTEAAFVLAAVVLAFLLRYDLKKATRLNKPFNWRNFVLSIVIALVALFGFLGLANMVDLLISIIGYPLQQNLPLPLDNVGWLVVNLVLLALIPAVCEEFLFRGVILTGLLPLGKTKAVLLSSLMFMLMHGNIQQTFFQFVFGVILAILFLKTFSLWTVMLAHFVNNAVVVLWQFFASNSAAAGEISFSVGTLLWAFGTAIAATVALYFLLGLLKRQKAKQKQVFVADSLSGNLVLEDELYDDKPIGISLDENLGVQVHTLKQEQKLYNDTEQGNQQPAQMTYAAKVLLFVGLGLTAMIWISDLVTKLLST